MSKTKFQIGQTVNVKAHEVTLSYQNGVYIHSGVTATREAFSGTIISIDEDGCYEIETWCDDYECFSYEYKFANVMELA